MKLTLLTVALVAVPGALMALTMAATPGDTPAENRESGTTSEPDASAPSTTTDKGKAAKTKTLKTATFGGGCFWCVEAVFQQLKGVERVVSGYAGGRVRNPTYRQVCTGLTGHAEVTQVTYNPEVISYPELLEVFWKTHDPTTLNRQGVDVGTQYRSIILVHDEEQRDLALKYKAKLNEAGVFRGRIVTEIAPMTAFYPAEKYHQDYFRNNSRNRYCQSVIVPKLVKFRQVFHKKVKN